MGLSLASTGINVSENELIIKKRCPDDKVIAIAGNPNVGKSTLFNALTGMKQHTGNWPGKTVANAQGYFKTKNNSYVLVDIPGTYSLMSHSPEEEIARNFICFSKPEAVIVVCDGTCLERNLNLVLQILEITKNVIVCVNLLDEAKRKGILVDLKALSARLGVPVVGTVAKNKKSLAKLCEALDNRFLSPNDSAFSLLYPENVEKAIEIVTPVIESKLNGTLAGRWLSLKLLEKDSDVLAETEKHFGIRLTEDSEIKSALIEAENFLLNEGISKEQLSGITASSAVLSAELICKGIVTQADSPYSKADRKADRILTSRLFGYPIMLLMLSLIFWLTISGANYISDLLSFLFSKVEHFILQFLNLVNAPLLLQNIVIEGMFRVPAWVISVMLPPMAIFFPLFTLLEDAGYLPRVAYNLDRPFKRCGSCGKQSLTMCMGFGCNAAGVVGARIIDSPRERLLAILTNSLVPCNGRFPAIIAIISMFLASASGMIGSFTSALILTGFILLGIGMTFLATRLLSLTLLKGAPSSYTLEMPPYRKPQIGRVIVNSIFDRTLFCLGRSIAVAVPAGIIIWLMANITVGGDSLLLHSARFLDPAAEILGLDGVILVAFVLGFPANEIVLPIVIMAYLSNASLTELPSLAEMRLILIDNGWTLLTALNTIILSLFHWPCSTTVLTIKKESGKVKWAFLSVLIPTAIGASICIITTLFYRLFF